jgi:hypothetical protein
MGGKIMRVYVATIPTKYEIVAVATTESDARYLAAEHAKTYLADVGIHYDNADKVLEYFGCCVTEIEIGTAKFVS